MYINNKCLCVKKVSISLTSNIRFYAISQHSLKVNFT